jgi:hypothetical protein
MGLIYLFIGISVVSFVGIIWALSEIRKEEK